MIKKFSHGRRDPPLSGLLNCPQETASASRWDDPALVELLLDALLEHAR